MLFLVKLSYIYIHHAAGGSLRETRTVKSAEELDQPKSRSKTLPHNIPSNLEVSIMKPA